MQQTQKIFCHTYKLQEKLEEIKSWKIDDKDKEKIKEFFRDYELGKITGRRGTNPEATLFRYLCYLKVGIENLKGETEQDVEMLLEDLLKDKIRYKGNRPYGIRSKKDILKLLSRYLEWKLPSNKAIKLCKILGIRIDAKRGDIEYLTDEEVDQLFKACNFNSKRFMIAVLASGGMRAEEFHNVRFSDIKVPEGKENFVKITIRNNFSKTEGRTISLYDKRCLKTVKDFLNERISEGIKPEDPVFNITYYANRKWIKNLGRKVLDKSVYYHIFRHTAATKLASKMNRQQLCIYFGWKFNSPMPDIYIQRAGVDMKDVEDRYANTEIEELNTELKEMKEKYDKVMPFLQELQEAMGMIKVK